MTTTSFKRQLHMLIDELPESELHTAKRFLEYLHDTSDQVLQALLQAPEDDEIETPEETASVAEAWEAYRRGEARAWEEVRQELVNE